MAKSYIRIGDARLDFGANTSPSNTFDDDNNVGGYRSGADEYAIAANGIQAAWFQAGNSRIQGNLVTRDNLTVEGRTVTINDAIGAGDLGLVFVSDIATTPVERARLYYDVSGGGSFKFSCTPDSPFDVQAHGLTSTGNLHGNTITSASTITAVTSISAPSILGALSGNAATATKWQTTRTIDITGDITATAQNIDGTANVAISATVDQATRWRNSVQINLTGDASGSVVFSGNTSPVSLPVTVANNSHTHDWGNITGEPNFSLVGHSHVIGDVSALDGGTYTPSINPTAPADPTPTNVYSATWLRIGTTVVVYGSFHCASSTTGDMRLSITIPITRGNSDTFSAAGVVSGNIVSGLLSSWVQGNGTTNVVLFVNRGIGNTWGSEYFTYSFSYYI